MKIEIKKANVRDAEAIFGLIHQLAEYEKAPEEVETSVEQLKLDGFGIEPQFHVLLAENEAEKIVGMAFYYFGYSTWKGKLLYLDDLVVHSDFRRNGIGEILITALFEIAKTENVSQVRWHVLDWNEPAIEFYKKCGYRTDSDLLLKPCKMWTDFTVE